VEIVDTYWGCLDAAPGEKVRGASDTDFMLLGIWQYRALVGTQLCE